MFGKTPVAFISMPRLIGMVCAFAFGMIANDQRLVAAIHTAPESVTATTNAAVTGLASSSSELEGEGEITFRAMHSKILQRKASNSGAFLAALDQSGGSTPRALEAYGMGPKIGNYVVGTER